MSRWVTSVNEIQNAKSKLEAKGVVFDLKEGNIFNAVNIGNKSLGRMDLLRRSGYYFINEKPKNNKKHKI